MQRNLKGEKIPEFPRMRFMGNKHKLLDFIKSNTAHLEFESVLDAFAGSGTVSHMFKTEGKRVESNDLLNFSYHIVKATVENNQVQLGQDDVEKLIQEKNDSEFIQQKFDGLYFPEEDNKMLDRIRKNIDKLNNEYKRSLALAALSRACMKKRPRGIFTYTGLDKYQDGRRDLRISMKQHFKENVEDFNKAVFDNSHENRAFNKDIFELDSSVDLVYMDPPYLSKHSDNRYLRRYHFMEGLCSYWEDVDIDESTKTKKIKKRDDNPFNRKEGIEESFRRLFKQFENSIIVVSYSSNSIPEKQRMLEILAEVKDEVEVRSKEYKYHFGNKQDHVKNDEVDEYLFIAK